MAYTQIEAAIQALLQDYTEVFPTSEHVTRGDWRVMGSGKDPFAVLWSGVYNEDQAMAMGSSQMVYSTKLLLGVRYQNNGETRVRLSELREKVIRRLRQYPHLDGRASSSAVLGYITSDGEPDPVVDEKGKGPFYLIQIFTIPSSEIDTVEVLE